MGIIFEKISMLHLEPTTRCNADCPSCGRSVFGRDNLEYLKNIDLPLSALDNFLASDFTRDTQSFVLCGTYGDPVAAKNIFEIIDLIRSLRKNAKILIHSNGSIRNIDWWENLARKNVAVFFALDGLSDTHAIYRKNVVWEKVIENASAFIKVGGRAIWKFILFEHNKHQTEEARRLAHKLGFKDFIVREDYTGEKIDYKNLSVDKRATDRAISVSQSYETLAEWNNHQLAGYDLNSVSCDAKNNSSLYLDAQGRIWPCCWIGQLDQTGRDNEREFFKMAVLNKYEKKFNSLAHYSLETILAHPWLSSDLQNSWSNLSYDPLNPLQLSCARNCANQKC
jgi:MoaA/NifB/PqqE/SkfB family radical SAM enzyme